MLTKAPSTRPKRERDRLRKGLARFVNWLGKYDLDYYFDIALIEPNVLETFDIISAVTAECEVIAHRLYPRAMWCFVDQEGRKEYAPHIEEEFLNKYPQLRGRVNIVYRRCGGPREPRGRFVPIFKGAERRGRSLEGVLKHCLHEDNIEVARKSTTTLNVIAEEQLEIKHQKAAENARNAEDDSHIHVLKHLRIIRYSNWQGFKNAKENNPSLMNGRIVDIGSKCPK
jgi:hypothetical protein